MIIFSPEDEIIFNGEVTDQSYRYKSIMGDNNLTLYIASPEHLEIPIGSYVYFQRDGASSGEYYYLLKPQNLIKNHTRYFEYTVILESQQYLLKTQTFKFFTVGTDGKRDSKYKLKGWITATPLEALEMVVKVMNEFDEGWTVGTCIEADRKLLEYSAENCFEFLQKIADGFNTEWYIIGKQISIGKVERDSDNPISLQYGYNNGLKSGVKRDIGDTDRINRLFIIGGDKNIYATEYGNDTLLFPKNREIKYDGSKFEGETGFNSSTAETFITDSDGMYVQHKGLPATERILDGTLEETDTYPQRVGTVSGVIAVNDEKALYDIVDNSIPESLNYNDWWLDEVTPTIIPQSGMLAGHEFEISKYTHSERRFELVPITDANIQMPKGEFIPAVGDKYVVFNMKMPQAYIDEAELNLLKKGVAYLYEESKQKFIITGELDGLFAQRNWAQLKDHLDVGYFVEFTDPQFFTEPQKIRITGITDYVNTPRKPKLELSNEVKVNTWASIKSDIRDTETTIDRTNQGNMAQTRRMWFDLKQTQEMMFDPESDFFTNFIQPLYIQTMQLVAGTQSLQFMFVDINDHSIPSDLPVPVYNNVDRTFTVQSRALKHLTLGIDELTPESNRNYKIWDISGGTSVLDPEKGYYLYAQCDKGGTTGQFVVSESPITIEQVDGVYHFWVGISNSEYDGVRSWRTMYGFTEILPGQITVDKIVSADGLSFLNLLANQFKLTNGQTDDNEQTLDWSDGTLTITNATINKSLKVLGEALIAGFYFSDQVIKSTAMNGSNYAMLLDGINGYIKLTSSESGTGGGGSGSSTRETSLSSVIEISSSNGTVTSRNDNGVAMVGANGVFANHAGQPAFPASTGVQTAGAVVGLGFGNMEKDDISPNFMAGVIGRATNSNSNPAPAYGGYFLDLFASGLILDTISISGTTNLNTILTKNNSFVHSISTVQQTVTLPSNAYKGTVLWLKQWQGGFMRVQPPTGQKLFDDATENTYLDISNGETAMCVFVGIMTIAGSDYGTWLISKF